MKLTHTALTDDILTRFESAAKVKEFRRGIADAIEYCAYVACMTYSDSEKRWNHFQYLTRKYAVM